MIPNPTAHPQPGPARPAAATDAAPGADDPDRPAIDSESAALLRSWLTPLVAACPSWEALERALDLRGYLLVFRDGRVCLTRQADGGCICSMRFLGLGLTELTARLGRPALRPLPGQPAVGVLCPRPLG